MTIPKKILDRANKITGTFMPMVKSIQHNEESPTCPKSTLKEWIDRKKESGEFFIDDDGNKYDYNCSSGKLDIIYTPK